MNRTKMVVSALTVAGVLALVGCSSDSDSDSGSDRDSSPTTEAIPEVPTGIVLPGEPRISKVRVTVDGTHTVIDPEQVECLPADLDSPDEFPEIYIAESNGQPPLIEVSRESGYAVKVMLEAQGPTYEVNESGFHAGEFTLTFGSADGDHFVLFKDTVVGDATVSGSLYCTDWEG